MTPKLVRWKWRWLVIGILLIGLWASHAFVLRVLAGFLIVDEPADDYQYVCLLTRRQEPDGDRCYDVAVNLHRRKPSCGVLVVEPRRGRLVETGVLTSFETLSRRALEARGLPPDVVSVIRSDGRDDWATARALKAWLVDRPDGIVVLLCEAFRSAHVRYVLDAVLDPAQAARVRVRALSDRQCDETQWWTSRRGVKAFGENWLRLFHVRYAGGDHLPPSVCGADDYESGVRRALPEAIP